MKRLPISCLPELPRLIRLKYLTPLNRWTGLDGPVALLRAATEDRPERSLVWRDLLAGYGVNDVASLVFRDRFGCWAFLELWRIGSGARFTEAEERFLAGIAGQVAEALRRCQARTFDVVAPGPDRTGPIVLMLSPQLEVRAQTPETDQYLRILVPPDGGPPACPVRGVQRGRPAPGGGGRRRPPPAVGPRAHVGRRMVDPAGGSHRRPDLRRRPRHRRHDRGHLPGREDVGLRAGLRAQRPRGGTARAPRRRFRHPPHRRADVPVGAHRPGPPEVDLRQDGEPEPSHPARPSRRPLTAVAATMARFSNTSPQRGLTSRGSLAVLRGIDEAVADARLGDQVRGGRVIVELLAQLAGVDPQVLRLGAVLRAPHLPQEHAGG